MSDLLAPEPTSKPIAAYGTYPVVGVGASAGGLEALEDLFRAVPLRSGMAYVVVQHLSPDFESKMDELLRRQTDIRVRRVESGDVIEPDTIYLVPPRVDMILASGRLHLSERERDSGVSLPIDHFFRSLAHDLGALSIGVVLSGTGSDGSRGVREIHGAGGLVVCQDPDTAKFDGMPKSALATGGVDLVLAPDKIPAALIEHGRSPVRPSRRTVEADSDPALDTIFRLLRRRADVDFSYYKESTVHRRIERRMAALELPDIEAYASRVARDEREVDALYADLLIGVTEFFRNPDAFKQLERSEIPAIVDHAAPETGVRAWAAGCGTGEEAYSLAMLFVEAVEDAGQDIPIKIFATDIDSRSLDVASAGLYPPDAFSHVTRARRERFFDQEGDRYRVVPSLREKVVFAHHNVMKDAPFTRLDLISCRNLLIYFRPAAQKKVLSLFHFGLRTGGTLFLGASETPGDLSDEFDTVNKRWRIYHKRRDVQLEPDLRMALPVGNALTPRPTPPAAQRWARSVPDSRALSLYDKLLDRHMPPSFLVDSRHELLHSFGGAERYLRLRGGRPTAYLLDLLVEDVKSAVSGALHKADKDQKPVHYSGLNVNGPDGRETVRLVVEPIDYGRVPEPHFLVQLETLGEAPPPVPADTEADLEKMSREYIASLENELRFTKENLQATIEELETSNEELQAANEELVSSNEELQSTNEELQSVNEELYTVNAEYQKKIRELVELTSDVDNLLQSTDIGVVFLDEDLCIRKLTSRASDIFRILPQDVGRPFDDFFHRLSLPFASSALAEVRRGGEPIECDTRSRDGRAYLFRALPYRSRDEVRGVVITVVDIEQIKRAESEVRQAVAQRERFLAMLSHELRNPMAAMETAASLLEAEDDARLCERATETMVRQARHMARLLDDVLDVSRMRQDRIELRRTKVDLVGIARDSIETMQSFAQRRGVSLELESGADELVLEADPDRLKQVQLNLLRNAIQHSDAGGAVRLEIGRYGDEAVLRVVDQGRGIAADMLDRIFEPFVQLDRPSGYGGEGLGLGLALARAIVRAHRGEIRAESKGPGQGCAFVVTLPALRQRASVDAQVRGADGRATSVLLVEDDPDNRDLMAALLRRRGFAVEVAADGPSGLAKLDELEPRIALVDLGLPGMDGLAVARRARERHARGDLFLVALTGHGQQRDRDEVFEAGFDQHLVKPVRIDNLIDVLRQVTGG